MDTSQLLDLTERFRTEPLKLRFRSLALCRDAILESFSWFFVQKLADGDHVSAMQRAFPPPLQIEFRNWAREHLPDDLHRMFPFDESVIDMGSNGPEILERIGKGIERRRERRQRELVRIRSIFVFSALFSCGSVIATVIAILRDVFDGDLMRAGLLLMAWLVAMLFAAFMATSKVVD